MPFRLLQAGNAAEQVLDARAHDRQAMGFETGNINDVIRFQHGREQVEAVLFAGSTVLVESKHIRKLRQLTGGIYLAQRGGRIQAAGAVCKGDVLNAVRTQPAGNGAQNGRVRRDCRGRIAPGEQIGLQQHLHAGFQIIRHVKGFKVRGNHAVDQRLIVARGFLNGYNRHKTPPCRNQK